MRLSVSAGRFALVGLAATGIHAATASGLIELANLGAAGANGAAFIVANLASYVANTRWSFRAAMGFRTWSRFFGVSVLCWGLTMLIAELVERAGANYWAGIAAVVILVPPVSFLLHRVFTYRPPRAVGANRSVSRKRPRPRKPYKNRSRRAG